MYKSKWEVNVKWMWSRFLCLAMHYHLKMGLNINTSLVGLSSAVPNQISISWASEIGKNYSMSVYLVWKLTSAMSLQRLKMKGIRNLDHSRKLIKEKLTAAPDSEIPSGILDVPFKENEARNPIPCSDLYTSIVFWCCPLSANEWEARLDLSCDKKSCPWKV